MTDKTEKPKFHLTDEYRKMRILSHAGSLIAARMLRQGAKPTPDNLLHLFGIKVYKHGSMSDKHRVLAQVAEDQSVIFIAEDLKDPEVINHHVALGIGLVLLGDAGTYQRFPTKKDILLYDLAEVLGISMIVPGNSLLKVMALSDQPNRHSRLQYATGVFRLPNYVLVERLEALKTIHKANNHD